MLWELAIICQSVHLANGPGPTAFLLYLAPMSVSKGGLPQAQSCQRPTWPRPIRSALPATCLRTAIYAPRSSITIETGRAPRLFARGAPHALTSVYLLKWTLARRVS
jgi:hypothetical protein